MHQRAKPVLQRRQLNKGDMLMTQGESGSSAYIIQSGHLEVFLKEQGQEAIIATLGPGEIVGEMAVLFGDKRSASVRAVTECTLAVMDRETVLKHLADSAPSIRALVKVLSQRLRTTSKKLIAREATLLQPEKA